MTHYVIKYTSQFRKQLKLAKKRGKQLNKLEKIVDLIVNDIPLPDENRDHALTGN